MTSFRACCLALAAPLAFAVPAPAQSTTAYDALRIVGNTRSADHYNRLISIAGEDGASQPKRWQLLFFDPQARHGLREFEVRNGFIVSERTPRDAKLSANPREHVMDLQKLNLNSDGAFTIADNEARNAGIAFDTLSYVLRSHEVTKFPVWVLDMRDVRRARAGSMLVNAETGAVMRPPSPGTQHTYINRPSDPRNQPPPTAQQSPAEGGFIGRARRTFDKAGRSIERTLLNAGGTLEEFFTGRRTLPTDPEQVPPPRR